MKTKFLATLATFGALAGSAFAAAGDGFTEATTIASGASSLLATIVPITAGVVGVGIALSLVKLVKRK